jgi:Rieske Fe-S protein
MATHAYFGKMSLELKLAQYRSYVVAGPLAKAPAGLFWDMNDPYHYVRRAFIDGRCYALVGGEDHRTGVVSDAGGDAPFRQLEAFAARVGVTPELRWSAQVVESADGLPYIGALEPEGRLYVATGFAGNGMTFGTLAARVIADAVLSRPNAYTDVFSACRSNLMASAAAFLAENAETAAHLLGGHLKPISHEPASELPVGVGRIIKEGGHKLAVYRDEAGRLHRVSAICTHQGCQVAFNPSELSWDCPCHGSRFDVDGRVLHGPALSPLERKA